MDMIIKGVPEDEAAAIERVATRHGRTREDEVRMLVHRAAQEELLLMQLEAASSAAARASAPSIGQTPSMSQPSRPARSTRSARSARPARGMREPTPNRK